MTLPDPPQIQSRAGLPVLKELLGRRNFLGALAAMHAHLGDIFRLSLPGFNAIVLAGPQTVHTALVEKRGSLHWRNDSDPVTGLLRHGLLVEDGQSHDDLRRSIMPALHRQQVAAYIEKMWRRTNQVMGAWQPGKTYDMLNEMRRIALLIIMDTLFGVDFTPDLESLFPSILRMLKTISPGLWLLGAPRQHYTAAIAEIDDYISSLIRDRRAHPTGNDDLLNQLILAGMQDDLIRDQVLTLLIAGHDTSTALLAWTLYTVSRYPEIQQRLHSEADCLPPNTPPTFQQVEELIYFSQVVNEVLRLYPPIHVGNRYPIEDLEIGGYRIPGGTRLMVSIYATHHDQAHWPEPEQFDPSRFAPGKKHVPHSYLPFGGGPRNCIGANFAQVEAKVVLALLFQRFKFRLARNRVRLHMGATLEPHPGVYMQVTPR